MRRPYLGIVVSSAVVGAVLAGPAVAQPTGDLFFSEYVEGSSLNKALEIENQTGVPVDLAAGTYAVEVYFNGSTSIGTQIPLTGTVADGDVFVVADDGADAAILAETDQVSGLSLFNGDDVVVLSRDGVVVDSFGQIGVDPGSQWPGGGQDDTLRRICDEAPDTDPTDAFDAATSWTSYPQNTFDGLGTPDCDGSAPPPPAELFIHDVQGSGAVSPYLGQVVAVEGVATSLFEDDDELVGFFLQEEDADADGDPATSEGVLVFCDDICPVVGAGDLAGVTGVVNEFFGMTQISPQTGADVAVTATGLDLPTASTVDLPAAGSTSEETTFEAVEGMIATFPDTMAVSEYFELARFGQVVLTETSRPYQFTHISAPDPVAYQAFLDELETRRIILDDDNNDQNDAIFGPDADEPYAYLADPWPTGGLSTSTPFRGGETVVDLTGVMHWSFEAWRVRPIDGVAYTFTETTPRTASPSDVGSDLTVATFNVLNYFTTINEPGNECASGFLCRGAHSQAELTRQRDKIVAALAAMDADVVGLIEIENTDGAMQNLVDGLNATMGDGTYAQVDTGPIGTDAIKVGFIYQPASISLAGDFAVLDSSVDPTFVDTRNRPVLIQSFTDDASGETFTAAVAHLKSKGSACDDLGDPDAGDGQGNCSGTRTAATQALASYLATDPTGSGDEDFLVLGDLNSYRNEDPIVALEDAGYLDLLEDRIGDAAYTYLFDGQLGYLDYAMANEALAEQVSGVTEWHINADEVPLFDYNDDIEDANERSFQRESSALPIYEPDAYRSSDHDPVLVGLDLSSGPSYQCAGATYTVNELEAAGYAVSVGTEGKDEMIGTDGRDAIFALGGNDTIQAGLGDDLVCGGDGRDQINTKGGQNMLFGEEGDDFVRGGMDADLIDAGDGDDRAWGRQGDDTIDGGDGNDRAWGNQGNDTCVNVESAKQC